MQTVGRDSWTGTTRVLSPFDSRLINPNRQLAVDILQASFRDSKLSIWDKWSARHIANSEAIAAEFRIDVVPPVADSGSKGRDTDQHHQQDGRQHDAVFNRGSAVGIAQKTTN